MVKSVTTETLGQRLTRIRKARGLTQKDLARLLDVTQSMVSEYEHDALRLHSEAIVALCRVLQISADQLLGVVPIETPPQPTSAKAAKLYRHLQAIEQLSRRDQQALLRTIEAFLARAG